MNDTERWIYGLCGGCQAWGTNPHRVDGKCTVCDRTTEQITAAHGGCDLDAAQRRTVQEFLQDTLAGATPLGSSVVEQPVDNR